MNKGELIERGPEGIAKLTDSANKKTLAYCLVFSIIFNIWQGYNNDRLTKKILNTTEDLQEKRIEELKSMVRGEVIQQVQPIAKKVDTIRQTADSTFRNINEKLP